METTGYIPRHSGRHAAAPHGWTAKKTASVIAAVIMIGAGAAIVAAVSARLTPRACSGAGGGCASAPPARSTLAVRKPAPRVFADPADRLSGPSAAAAGGGRLWITNVLGNSVTELSAASG